MKFKIYVDYTLEKIPRPFYVGKGMNDRVSRIKRNKYHTSIMNKYGIDRRIVFVTNIESEAFIKERQLIAELKTFFGGEGCWGANFTLGGEGPSGRKATLEESIRMSEQRQGCNHPMWGRKHTKESIYKNSESNKIAQAGENNAMYGKFHSDETKIKIADNQRGWHHSEESKAAISTFMLKNNPMKGKKHSQESRDKMRQARLGKIPWNKGKNKQTEVTPEPDLL